MAGGGQTAELVGNALVNSAPVGLNGLAALSLTGLPDIGGATARHRGWLGVRS